MEIVTVLGLTETLARAERAGALRGQLVTAVEDLLHDVDVATREAEEEVHRAWVGGIDKALAALGTLNRVLDQLPTVHDLVTTALDAQRRADDLVGEVMTAYEDIAAFIAVDSSEALLPDDLRQAITAFGSRRTAPSLHATTMLRTAREVPGTATIDGALGAWDFLRSWALHGLVLVRTAQAEPDEGASTAADAAAARAEVESKVRGFRDQLQAIAGLLRDGRAAPEFLLSAWTAVHRTESWVREDATTLVPAVSAAATAAVDAQTSDADRLARDAALAYEGVRELLALTSGARAAVRAYTIRDTRELELLARSGRLPAATATVDLPRTSPAQAADAAPGSALEVAGVIRSMDITAGGPAPRSVLTIGAATGAKVQVLVPFTAVDSFGVRPGVWVQARGAAFPDGKDGIAGPLLQTRRVRREAAAASSFHDAVVWLGRRGFELRPGQADIVAGRRAGDESAVVELGLRR